MITSFIHLFKKKYFLSVCCGSSTQHLICPFVIPSLIQLYRSTFLPPPHRLWALKERNHVLLLIFTCLPQVYRLVHWKCLIIPSVNEKRKLQRLFEHCQHYLQTPLSLQYKILDTKEIGLLVLVTVMLFSGCSDLNNIDTQCVYTHRIIYTFICEETNHKKMVFFTYHFPHLSCLKNICKIVHVERKLKSPLPTVPNPHCDTNNFVFFNCSFSRELQTAIPGHLLNISTEEWWPAKEIISLSFDFRIFKNQSAWKHCDPKILFCFLPNLLHLI